MTNVFLCKNLFKTLYFQFVHNRILQGLSAKTVITQFIFPNICFCSSASSLAI